MHNLSRYFHKGLFVAVLFVRLALAAEAESVRVTARDTLSLRIDFPVSGKEILPGYDGNAERIALFRSALEEKLSVPGSVLTGVFIRTGASPDGGTRSNLTLASERMDAVRTLLVEGFGLDPALVHVFSSGESWEEFIEVVRGLDVPWKDEVISIASGKPRYVMSTYGVSDLRKSELKHLRGGEPWRHLTKEVFPRLRSAYGDAVFVFTTPFSEGKYSVSVTEKRQDVVRDTVYIYKDTLYLGSSQRKDINTDVELDESYASRIEGKKFLMAVRTNILAVPLANVGLELALGKHVSIGLDYYYPWIWRNSLHKDCTEMLAYGMDVRYWFGSSRQPSNARLIGHSVGIYGAGGHYDFERNWHGYQGTFYNVGVDWMYAFPLFKGRIHMELELGIGFIYSDAQPYNCYEPYGDCFREPGIRKIVRWFGPTRAQVSIVVPIYIKDRRVAR